MAARAAQGSRKPTMKLVFVFLRASGIDVPRDTEHWPAVYLSGKV